MFNKIKQAWKSFTYVPPPRFKNGDIVKIKINNGRAIVIGQTDLEEREESYIDFFIRLPDMTVVKVSSCEIELYEE